jgi:hypothetical protein
MSPFFYVYVDEHEEPAGICVKLDSEIINRESSGDIKTDAVATGKFLAGNKIKHWLYSSSIDNYPYDVEEDPDYCLRELIQEGYVYGSH